MRIFYFDVRYAVEIHDFIIEKSGGMRGIYPDGRAN